MGSGKPSWRWRPRPRLGWGLALVAGGSMLPLLPEGAWVLVLNSPRLPRLGEVVVLEHPQQAGFELIKRVAALSAEAGLLWVAGDNRQASTDSEDFGAVPLRLLRGRVLLRLRPLPWRMLRAEPRRL